MCDFRCILSEYTVNEGGYHSIWNDKGSGVHTDVGLFSNTETDSINGLFSNTFTARTSYNEPSSSPSLLNSGSTTLQSLLHQNNENLAIKVYEGTKSKLIWRDKGSGAYHDLSTHRPKGEDGYYPVGDIALGNYGSPKIAHLVKEVKSGAISFPTDFRRIWKDKGSGAHWDGSFWEPICQHNYVPLGHVSVRSHNGPSTKDVVCVKREYVVKGKWVWRWNDKGSGASKDCSVYQAQSLDSSSGQGLQAMGAVAHHGAMKIKAYVLNSAVIQYIADDPATEYILTDVEYFVDNQESLTSSVEQLARTIVDNQGSIEQSVVRDISYTYEETHDWSVEYGLEIGIEISVTAGIPDIAEATVSSTIQIC